MRIGTWNLDNRPLTDRHRGVLVEQRCDVWLLTEVNPKAMGSDGKIAGFHCHLSAGVMARKQHWAAVLSLQALSPLPDPHAASAAAIVNGVTFCSTILPWAGCGKGFPWVGNSLAAKTAATLSGLLGALPQQNLVWGGDFNQNLEGGWQNVGTIEGQRLIRAAFVSLRLQVPTRKLLHQNNISHSIDHIGVPIEWEVSSAARVKADGLSDHDLYVVEVYDPAR